MPIPLLAHLWLVASSPVPSELAPGEVDAVEVPWARVQAMRDALQAEAEAAVAPAPWVKAREVELTEVEGGFALHGRWTIVAPRAGWVAHTLLGPGIELRSATLGGAVAPVVTLPSGTVLAAWIDRDVELEVRAFVPSTGERLDLGLLPATRGRLRVTAAGRVPVPRMAEGQDEAPPVLEGGVVWSGASSLALELRDPTHAPPARQTLAVAHAGVGLTVGDAEVRGRAHLQWELRHGSLPRVRATVAGLGDDLTVEGPDVAQWTRTGDTLEVELTAPATTRVDLELRWTQAIASGDQARLPLPRIEPEAWRSESSLQLARDGEIEVIPEVAEGTAIAAAALPSWGQGLVEGTPTAAYQRAGGPAEGHLELLRFVPVPGPPTVIDVATYTVATTDEGRVLMKAHYDLRNDRGAHLTVRPPPGLRIIGARVGRQTALPSRGEDGAWRIPLRRSLETVDGLLSFPVEVILLGEQEPWQRRERRALPLPALDAPVAAARVTVFLPPRYRSRLEAGEHGVVDVFGEGEGVTYGRGVGDDDTALTDALLEDAVQGYLENDFERAQERLSQLEQLGLKNENVARLQANIDVIEGKGEAKDKGDVTLQRRVKEQAKARAVEDFRRQEQLIAQAEQAAEAGDYAQAEAQYMAALDLGAELAKLEQAESVEQDMRNADVVLELQQVSKKGEKLAYARKARERTRQLELEERVAVDDGPLEGLGPSTTASSGSPAQAPREYSIVGELDSVAVHERGAAPPEPEPDEPSPPPQPIDEPSPVLEDQADVGIELASRRSGPLDGSEPVRRVRRRNLLETKFKAEERKVASGRRSRRATGSGESAGVTVYDFEDDDLDGEMLRPEGASVASRARSSHGGMITVPTSFGSEGEVASADDAPAADPATASADSAPARRDDALPAPEVTASALSVVVPVTGQAVRYEQLLIDANQIHAIQIHARRRLRR